MRLKFFWPYTSIIEASIIDVYHRGVTIAKGTLPLAIFGPSSYGLRQGLLMVPARFGQAGAPYLFALLMERYGALPLLLSTALGLAGLVALLAPTPSSTAERA